VVPKVLQKAFDEIFNLWTFFKNIKNVEQNKKNVKKRKNVAKRFLRLWSIAILSAYTVASCANSL